MEKQQPSKAEIEAAEIESLRENADAIRMFAEARDGEAGALRDVLQRRGDEKVRDALLGAANVLDYWHRRAVLDSLWPEGPSTSGED